MLLARFRITLLVTLTMLSSFSFAQSPKPRVTLVDPAQIFARNHTEFEFGLSCGTPSLINLHLGVWGPSSFPFVFRVAGMYAGQTIFGYEAEVSWIFAKYRDLMHFASIGYSFTESKALYKKDTANAVVMSGVGPFYGIRVYGIIAQIGLVFGQSDTFDASSHTTAVIQSPFPRFSLGYSYFFQ